MFAPDGTLGDIPTQNVSAALKAGGKMGVELTSPDGTPGVVPIDRVHEAIRAGGILKGASGPSAPAAITPTQQGSTFLPALAGKTRDIAAGQLESWRSGGGAIGQDTVPPANAWPQGVPKPAGLNVPPDSKPQGPQTFNPFHPIDTAGYLVPQPVKDIVQRVQNKDYQGAVGEALPQIASQLPAIVQGVSATRDAINAPPKPHPQAASNLAAAADVGGKPAGVSAVYEDYAKPAADEYRNAAAREGITPQDFKGRNGYQVAIQAANRLQSDANAQFQPYLEQVQDRLIPDSMSTRIKTQLGPIMDALPGKLSQAISDAKTVGDLNDIRMDLNKGGTRFFNATTDTQFSAPESQQAMAQAGNVLRNEVYGHIQDVTGVDVRPIKQLEGNAINLRNQFQKAAPILSKVADQAEAPPTWWQNVRSGHTAVEMGKSFANPLTKRIGLDIQPPNRLELFNTQMQRATRGGSAAPVPIPGNFPAPAQVPDFPYSQLPRRVIEEPTPQYPQLPQTAGPANFGQTEVRGTPFIPRAEPPKSLPPASSIQIGGTTPRLSLREQLKTAGRRR
jgi:hypothetical protein